MFHNLRTLRGQPFGLYEAIQKTEYGLEPIFQGVEVCRWNLNTLGIYTERERERETETGAKGGGGGKTRHEKGGGERN